MFPLKNCVCVTWDGTQDLTNARQALSHCPTIELYSQNSISLFKMYSLKLNMATLSWDTSDHLHFAK